MAKYQYRIEEKNGLFFIQVAVPVVKGILWWRKKSIEWRAADINGKPCVFIITRFSVIDTYKIRLDPFPSLEAAELKIKQFIWPGIKHHYPFGKPGLLPVFENPPPAPEQKTTFDGIVKKLKKFPKS